MDNTFNWNKAVKHLNIGLMLLTMTVLGLTTLLFETIEMFELDELDEIHKFCGYKSFALIFIHLILYRKRLTNALTFKTK
jgi:predicted ferric reductase